MAQIIARDADQHSQIIGHAYAEVQGMDIDWLHTWPMVDPETMTVTGIVYIGDLYEGQEWETAALVDGQVVRGEHQNDFAVLV